MTVKYLGQKALIAIRDWIKDNFYTKTEIDENEFVVSTAINDLYNTIDDNKEDIDNLKTEVEKNEFVITTSINDLYESGNNKELLTNKVNVISEDSNDTQYPSTSAITSLVNNGYVTTFDFINDDTINWTSSDKAGVTRVIFNNINSILVSISFYIVDDSVSTGTSDAYAVVYSTEDHGNNGEWIGCSTNTINPSEHRGEIVTFYFDNLEITSDFFVEFYKEQKWSTTGGTNYRISFRLQTRNVASDETLLAYLNNSILYGCSSSSNRWLCACSVNYYTKAVLTPSDITGKEDVSNKVTLLSETNTDDQYPSAKAVYDIIDAEREEIANVIDNFTGVEWISNKVTTITDGSSDTQYPSAKAVNDLFLNIDKSDYTSYIGISTDNINYNKIIFINDGSGIIHKGILYINNPYWIKLVDELPETEEDNTLYLIKEE